MVRTIPLTRGHLAIVDDSDYDYAIASGPWCASEKPNTVYALKGIKLPDGRWTTVRLHNLLTGWPYVDHVNGNGLDNRRANLRPADAMTNGRNRGRPDSNTSGFKGVVWHAQGRKWMAQITVGGCRLYLGLFVLAADAARAYDAAAVEHFGEFARLNFPREEIAS